MKIKLVFPPFWAVTQPYLSIPSLVAYLKKKGIDSEQIDLNLESMDYILSKEFALKCKLKYENKFIGTVIPAKDATMLKFANYMVNHVDEFKNTFRSKRALNIDVYRKCDAFLQYCLVFVSRAYGKESIGFNSFKSQNYNEFNSKSIMQCMEDVMNQNVTDSIAYDVLTPYIDSLTKNTDFIGISVTGTNQILPSFMLAAMIKKNSPDIKILFGGSVITRLVKQIQNLPSFFDFVDYFLYNEGEHPLHMLIRHLNGEIKINDVPNLIYRNENGEVMVNPDNCYLKIIEFPTPIFNKEDIPRYFSPEVVLPLLSCRGCFWGKCTFCDHSYVYQGKFQKRPIEYVINDIKTFYNEYDCRAINFHDEAIAPVEMSKLSEALIANNLDIKWTSCARLDLVLDKEVLDHAHSAGLKALLFGFESINQRVLSKMNKGTRTDNIKKIFKDSASVGIWNHAFYICGFPTETLEEFQETLDFVKDNKEYIHSSGCGLFSLGCFSPVAQNPEAYDIRIIDDDDDDLKFWYKYETISDSKKERENYYKEHKEEFSVGRFREDEALIQRDHWLFFCDLLFDKYDNPKNEDDNMIKLVPLSFWDIEDNKLCLYDIENMKLRIASIDIKYLPLFKEIIKYGNKLLIMENSEANLGIPYSEAAKKIEDFEMILSKIKFLK